MRYNSSHNIYDKKSGQRGMNEQHITQYILCRYMVMFFLAYTDSMNDELSTHSYTHTNCFKHKMFCIYPVEKWFGRFRSAVTPFSSRSLLCSAKFRGKIRTLSHTEQRMGTSGASLVFQVTHNIYLAGEYFPQTILVM